MTVLKPMALAIGASLLAMACAPTSSTETGTRTASNANQCFFVNNISGFQNVKSDSLQLTISDGRVFNAQTLSDCSNLDFALAISVRPQIGLDSLCTGDLANLVTGEFQPQAFPCQIQIGNVVTANSAAAN